MGCGKRKQPLRRKVSIGPALMVCSSSPSAQLETFAENTAQPHSHPFVLRLERGLVAMFEIFKPASQRAVHILNSNLQGAPVRAPGFPANGVPQLLNALGARPSIAPLKVIAQKVEATSDGRIHEASLLRMQGQSVCSRPGLHPRKRC